MQEIQLDVTIKIPKGARIDSLINALFDFVQGNNWGIEGYVENEEERYTIQHTILNTEKEQSENEE